MTMLDYDSGELSQVAEDQSCVYLESRIILTTEPHVSTVVSYNGIKYKIRKPLATNVNEDHVVTFIAEAVNLFLAEFMKSESLTVARDNNFEPSRKRGQFYSEIVLTGSSKDVSEAYDKVANVCRYLSQEIQENIDIEDTLYDENMITAEEMEFLDYQINTFVLQHSGRKITKPFDCEIGFSGSGKIYFNGRFRRKTLHQTENDASSVDVIINGFDDVANELRGTIQGSANDGKKIKFFTKCHDVFVMAANGYDSNTVFRCLYRQKKEAKGKSTVNELLAFNVEVQT